MNMNELQNQSKKAASLLRMMSNERRLLILCQLGQCERSVSELVAMIGLSQSALSQHLGVLRKQGLVATRRQAQSIYYSIKDPAVTEILKTLYQLYCPQKQRSL